MKIGKKIRSKSGFTLMELLGAIVIIGILGTIATVSVFNIKNKSKERFNNAQVETIKQAGQTYFTDNKKLLPAVIGQTNYVALEELIEKNYIDRVYDSSKKEFKTGTDSNGVPYSYVWVKKISDKEYEYGAHCTDSQDIVYGDDIEKAKKNTSDVEFVYKGFYEPANKNVIYTSGNNANTYVEIKITGDTIKKYKYEIYKRNQGDFSQYKTSTNDIDANEKTTRIKINANDYEEGEYSIKVTTYNETSQTKTVASNKNFYLDKTAPNCSITSDYKVERNSDSEDWYNLNSTYNNKKLGENNKLPIYAKGSDQESGLKKITFYSNPKENKDVSENQTYKNTGRIDKQIGNTKRTGKMYYAEVEDNVGNKRVCTVNFKVDTTPPSCRETGIESGVKGNKVSNRQWYLTDVTTYGYFTDENSGVTAEKQISAVLNRTSSNAQTSTIYQKDRAGNEGKCVVNNIYIDKEDPTCSSSGGSERWVNQSSSRKGTTLKGSCSDVGSGCVAGSESGKTYDGSGNVYWDIDWEGNWTNLSPGTVYDEAGRSTTCPGNQTVRHDWTPPTCSSSGGSERWVNSSSSNKSTTLKGTCNDGNSGCVAGVESGKTYDGNGNVYWKITKEGNWTGLSPGTVYDKAGNSTMCPGNQTVRHDWTAPKCNATGYVNDWTNKTLYLRGTCAEENVSGCKVQTFTKTISSENINNDNYEFGTVEDNAGNSTKCYAPVHTDYTPPTCSSSGGSNNWVNANTSVKMTKIKGVCSDQGGSGCTGDVSKTIREQGNWPSLSPGTVYDKAGNSTECPGQTVKHDWIAPTCSATGGSTSWTNRNVRLSGTCTGENVSGCRISSVSETVTTDMANSNYRFGYVEDNAGNRRYCYQPVYRDTVEPVCTNKTLERGNGTSISENTWYSIQKAIYSAKCSDRNGSVNSGCVRQNYSSKTTSEGVTTLEITVEDNAGNWHYCSDKVVKIDRTPPRITNMHYDAPKCNSTESEHYLSFDIEDDLSGLRSGSFLWSTAGGVPNAGNSPDRSGHSSSECIASANADSSSKLDLSYKICDVAGNCSSG